MEPNAKPQLFGSLTVVSSGYVLRIHINCVSLNIRELGKPNLIIQANLRFEVGRFTMKQSEL